MIAHSQKHTMDRVSLAFVILLLAGPALAHDDYDFIRRGDFRDARGNHCCGPADCRKIPVASGDVIELDNGDFRYMPTNEVIPRADTRPSPDGNFYRCFWHEDGVQKTRRLCFWRPVRDS
jgi:hypothetical protein